MKYVYDSKGWKVNTRCPKNLTCDGNVQPGPHAQISLEVPLGTGSLVEEVSVLTDIVVLLESNTRATDSSSQTALLIISCPILSVTAAPRNSMLTTDQDGKLRAMEARR